jgi:esterase/lipase superfamily enzyme/Tfp pilus assembly protein PilF
MLARSFWRTTALIMFVAFLSTIRPSSAPAQQSKELETLRQQIEQFDQGGKYAEALVLQRRLAAEIERAETASAGAPGAKTAGALVNVAWHALFAHDFEQALAVSDRAHALEPTQLDVETNRAHALLLLGRVDEARALYRSYKGKPISLTNDQLWEDAIADDVEALARAGIDQPVLKDISAELGGKSGAVNIDLTELNRKVQELDRTKHYQEAEATAEQYAALARQRYSEDHPKFATAISWLGRITQDQRRYSEAMPLYKRALAIDEKALGPDHTTVATDLDNLAWLYKYQGRYAEAEPLFKRALAIDEKALGPDHPRVATALNGLAALYRDQGRYDEAEPLCKRALAIEEKALGPDHADVGTDLNNLAELYWLQARYGEAEPLYKRALAIAEKALGPDHRDVAVDLNNLALVYKEQGRYDEAEPLMKRALAIAEKALGPDHPEMGTPLDNLASLYDVEGRYDEAEPLFKRALAIEEKALGPDHPDVGTSLNNLAVLYVDQGNLKEAEPLYLRAIAIGDKAFGPDHPKIALMRSNLGGLYKSQGRYGEAEPLLKTALDIKEKIFGPAHAEVAYSLSQLGDLYRLEGKCGESELYFVKAQRIGAKAIREVPVLFGTDRKRDMSQTSVKFGGERDEKLSFGLVVVTVPEPQANTSGGSGADSDSKSTSSKSTSSKSTSSKVTEARRLATHCIQQADGKQIVEDAVRQVDGAKAYPNQALVFVHGFNTSFEDAARRAAQIAYDIKFDGATFLFSWPTRGGVMAYIYDRDTVDIAADHLRDFLQRIVAETKVTRIHFIAHSMGNMVLLRALDRVAREDANLRGLIGEVIEAAPDVDATVYRHLLEAINPEQLHKFTLYAARADWALRISGWLRGNARAGYVSKDQPLIVKGVDTIDITSAGTSLFDMNHDLYASNPILVGDIRRIIEKGEWPPDKRTKEFEQVSSKDGTYWRLLPPQPQTTVH